MRRKGFNDLNQWKLKKHRKPLIIRGARQVGKTWLMKKFGDAEYEKMAYVNLESSSGLKDIFKTDFNLSRILLALQVESGISIEAENTLIVLDEIQEAEGALTSLKYFYENAPEYHIICAGSLLGIALNGERSFPVGKVDFMDLYPLSFSEYLEAKGEDTLLAVLDSWDSTLIKSFKTKYIQGLKEYYYVGGMPEAVSHFIETSDLKEVRQIQKDILTAYEQDFSKHAPAEIVPRIRMLWNNIPAQLARENKKFVYGAIKKGSRAKDYELAMTWLIDCGLIHKVHRVSKPAVPLKAYIDNGAFKLFLVDVGLLAAMSLLDAKSLIERNALFQEFKGALTEQYVLQQLSTLEETSINYWTAKNATAEIDFVIQQAGKIIPVEVKAEENLKAKSLKQYVNKFHPKVAVRTSLSDYRKEEWLTNLPLYAIHKIKDIES